MNNNIRNEFRSWIWAGICTSICGYGFETLNPANLRPPAIWRAATALCPLPTSIYCRRLGPSDENLCVETRVCDCSKTSPGLPLIALVNNEGRLQWNNCDWFIRNTSQRVDDWRQTFVAEMKVLVIGFPKTGTKSLHAALKKLGYTVYDYEHNFYYLRKQWLKVLSKEGGTKEDFYEMYRDVDASMDILFCVFWKEILEAFPDTKVTIFQSCNITLGIAEDSQKCAQVIIEVYIPSYTRIIYLKSCHLRGNAGLLFRSKNPNRAIIRYSWLAKLSALFWFCRILILETQSNFRKFRRLMVSLAAYFQWEQNVRGVVGQLEQNYGKYRQ